MLKFKTKKTPLKINLEEQEVIILVISAIFTVVITIVGLWAACRLIF